jgi:diadenylate cyclase
VEELASHKTGALIVLERDIGLRTFVESGVRLDAHISRDLLLSIFQPGLPLHDGAVIVQNDRVAAAACFLPLTTNPAFRSELGTRHRAAIGITEETDCLTLVVSEETGRVSVAAAGVLKQGLSMADVEQRIHLHFGVRRPAPAHADEFSIDMPLAPPAGPVQAESPAAKAGRP